jgi:hypothetical protein
MLPADFAKRENDFEPVSLEPGRRSHLTNLRAGAGEGDCSLTDRSNGSVQSPAGPREPVAGSPAQRQLLFRSSDPLAGDDLGFPVVIVGGGLFVHGRSGISPLNSAEHRPSAGLVRSPNIASARGEK